VEVFEGGVEMAQTRGHDCSSRLSLKILNLDIEGEILCTRLKEKCRLE
jgi:hypothetical protein